MFIFTLARPLAAVHYVGWPPMQRQCVDHMKGCGVLRVVLLSLERQRTCIPTEDLHI